MTAASPHPKLRYLKPAVYVAMIAATCWCLWTTIRQEKLDRSIRDWIDLGHDNSLQCYDRQVCMIRGHETNPVGRVLLGRREVRAIIYHEDDGNALLTMPECPVRLIVWTGRNLPKEQVDRLQERFGAENVE